MEMWTKKPPKEEVVWLFQCPWKITRCPEIGGNLFPSFQTCKNQGIRVIWFLPCLKTWLSQWIHILKIRSLKSCSENRTMQMNCGYVFWGSHWAFTRKVFLVKRMKASSLGKTGINVWCWYDGHLRGMGGLPGVLGNLKTVWNRE